MTAGTPDATLERFIAADAAADRDTAPKIRAFLDGLSGNGSGPLPGALPPGNIDLLFSLNGDDDDGLFG